MLLLGLGVAGCSGRFLKSWAVSAEMEMEAAGQDWIDERRKDFRGPSGTGAASMRNRFF